MNLGNTFISKQIARQSASSQLGGGAEAEGFNKTLSSFDINVLPPLKPIRLYCTAYYWIFKSKKIFGAFQHQKFYLLSINNSFGFLLNILNEEIIKDTRSTKLINITT